MKSGCIFSIALSLLSILAIDSRGAEPLDRSVSPSGQFIIYGSDAAWRGAISKLAEQTKANLLSLLQRHDEWTTAVVINLQPRAANLPEIPNAALHFSQTGTGLKLQLDLAISREMNPASVEREILRVILLETIYHNQTGIAPGENFVEAPGWLVDGLLAVAPNRNRATLISSLAASERLPRLDEFLHERPELLDPVGQSLYRAYSFALVRLLAENPARLGRYIDNLAFASNDPLLDVQKSFPEFKSADFEKIWQSKIAALKESGGAELLAFSETDQKLDSLLQTKFPTDDGREKSLSLEALCQRKLSATQKTTLQRCSAELSLLAGHANPVLRPVIQDYRQLVDQLALGKNHGVVARMNELKTLRTKLSARLTEIDDYMNWFEATQLQTSSGLFENLNRSTGETGPRPRRKDAFSAYLDAMEAQF